MDAASLWAGNHYAWMPSRPKNFNIDNFSASIRRVRIITVKKIRQPGNYERRTTMATFEILDWDGEQLADQAFDTVPAREIVDYWSEYHGVHEERFEQHKERKRQEAQKAHEEKVRRQTIVGELVERGFDSDDITFGPFNRTVIIPLEAMEVWLYDRQMEKGETVG